MSITVIVLMFQFQLAITNIVYNHDSLRGPKCKNFSGKKSQSGDQGKNIPSPRFFPEISLNFMNLTKNFLLNPVSFPLFPPQNFENFKS
jgi:hypothetical protein